jgi:glutamine amidotransferase
MIAVVNAGSGNIGSVVNVIRLLQHPVCIARKPDDLLEADTIILPGVGSAGSYMRRLEGGGLRSSIVDAHRSGVRLVGICLGFQVLFNGSEEDGGVECLGLLNGVVTDLKRHTGHAHTGWAPFEFERTYMSRSGYNPIYASARSRIVRGRVYYNHEYGYPLPPPDSGVGTLSITDFSFDKFASMIIAGNVIGMQFHPEKSQKTGLSLLSMVL